MPEVKNLYVYTDANPPQPLLEGKTGDMSPPNLYQIPDTNNNAGIQQGQHYLLSIGAITPRNPGSTARCDAVAPPSYTFIVTAQVPLEENPEQSPALG